MLSDFSKTFTGAFPQFVGDDVFYEISITNSGSVLAQDVILTDTPPLGLNFVDSVPTLPTPTTNPLTTALERNVDVPAQTTQTYTLRFTVASSSLPSTFTNTGAIAF